MNKEKTLIIALIAIVVIFLAGIVAFAPSSTQNQTAYSIPLKAQNFGYFEMLTPADSNFTIKNNKIDYGKGMVFWHNAGKFSNETDSVTISKNYTDDPVGANMKLVSQNDSQKVYMSKNTLRDYYKIVKTVNGTDIVLAGYNLPLLEEMARSIKIKDTSKLTLEKPVNDTQKNTTVEKTVNQTANNTTVEKTVEKNQTENKTEAKVENKTPVQTVIEKKQVEVKSEPKVEPTKKSTEPLVIGGGSFTTGSALADKTYAKIYLGTEHAGEEVGVKIFYSRDGTALNKGNYVPATIDPSGYVSISSADSYSKYPDFARVEVYDSSGNLASTQGIHLDTTSGTQYF